ncbi:hypothetical protein P9477_01840 [Enterobacter mori]|uniref:zinc ribbon domain-containing protein n=1 Tax=Enterobacteriaceae TaxID=543 RepID=UPI0038903D48
MAMKKCRECGQGVSSSAKVCPHCGIKNPYASPKGLIKLLLLVGFIAFAWLTNQGGKPSSTSESSYQTVEDTQELRDEAQLVIQAKGYNCKKVNSTHAAAFGGELTVFCDDVYQYKIKDNGGKYAVTAE